mgnify:CR=1 FL=1|tara:strand:+ start:7934 stop:8719 length:786 start_codon:yes stop_codon:yes gene_type:complete
MKISIITINYNDKQGLEKTINSVLNQTHKDLEYIVIDGGSNDGSKELIKQNNSKITYWVSEKDKGVYDAMNKGIEKATGDYLLFLNSGDYLYDDNVFEEISNQSNNAVLIVGNTCLPDKNGKIIKYDNLTVDYLAKYSVNHQTVFFKNEIFKKYKGYNLDYKMAADYDLILRVLIDAGFKYQYIDVVVANYDLNGISSQESSIELMAKEKQQIRLAIYPQFVWDRFNEMNSLRYELKNLYLSKFVRIALFFVKIKNSIIRK